MHLEETPFRGAFQNSILSNEINSIVVPKYEVTNHIGGAYSFQKLELSILGVNSIALFVLMNIVTMNIGRRMTNVVRNVNLTFQVYWVRSERSQTTPERQNEQCL